MYERKESYASALVEANDPTTTNKRLQNLARLHYGEINIARAIALNPSCPPELMGTFLHVMRDLAEKNPAIAGIKSDPHWSIYARHKPCLTLSRWSGDIDDNRPEIVRVLYAMEHGESAYKRWVIGLHALPDFVLREHVDSKSAPLRKAIASRASLPADLFQRLANDKSKTVRLAVATNAHAPSEVVALLAADSEPLVACAAQANPACPDDAVHMARLAQAAQPTLADGPLTGLSREQRITLANDPSTPADKLLQLAADNDPCIRFITGLNASTNAEILTRLGQDSLTWVQASAAFNSLTPATVLEQLLSSKDSDIQLGLAGNRALTQVQQLGLVETADDRALEALANLTTHASVWEKIAAGGEIGKDLAEKNKTWRHYLTETVELLKKKKFTGLTQGGKFLHLFTARMAARHEKCPPKIARFYAQYIFADYSQNPQAALAMLEGKLAVKAEEYAEWKVNAWFTEQRAPGHVANFYIQSDHKKRRAQAVSSWSTQLMYLLPIALDEETNTRRRLAERSGLIQFMYELLARDDKPGVREKIAGNKNTPKALLRQLADDQTSTVRSVAAKRLPKSESAKGAAKSTVVNQGSATDRARLAKRSDDPELLLELLDDRAASVRLQVAENYETPKQALDQLTQDPDVKVRRSVARRCRNSVAVLPLLQDEDREVRLNASKNYCFVVRENDEKSYTPEFLAAIVAAEDEEIRKIVAGATPDEALHDRYLADKNQQVIVSLAGNQHLSDERRRRLAEQSNDYETLKSLARKSSDEALFLLVCQKVQHLGDWPNRNWARAITEMSGMMSRPTVQEALCQHPYPEVRTVVAQQKALTECAQTVLAQDSDERIQKLMARRTAKAARAATHAAKKTKAVRV